MKIVVKNKQNNRGFASLLTVITVSVGLILILISMYENTVNAQDSQRDHQLRNDYTQREEAFLRSLTNIIPNKAMACMQDGSGASSVRKTVSWQAIFNEALVQSNARTAIDADTAGNLGLSAMRNLNAGDSSLAYSTVVKPLSGNSHSYNRVTSGTNITATTNFPPPLEAGWTERIRDRRYPVISLSKKYGDSAAGWVKDSVTEFPLYNRVDAPQLHFNYGTGPTIIAKHNWWAFEMSFAEQHKSATELVTRKKRFLISLYEIPSQLPINSQTYSTFGLHDNGSAWSNINIAGGVFAQRVKTEGSFSSDAIASRKGVELSANTTLSGGLTGTKLSANPFTSDERDVSETNGNTFPIASSSDGGRISFVPINRGLEFYDYKVGGGDSGSSTNGISLTSWDYYTIGAKQCRMRLEVTDVISSANQTPTQITFSYFADDPNDSVAGAMVTKTFTKGTNWPDEDTAEGGVFPFHSEISASSHYCLGVYMDRLVAYLQANHGGNLTINNSLAVNCDYVGNGMISKPTFPSQGGDLGVLLKGCTDLTMFPKGLSMIANMRLIIADDANITATAAPAGVVLATNEEYFPPLSLFAPEKRYGDTVTPLKVDVTGQLGSLAKGNNSPNHIADLKSGASDSVIANNITAELKPITHPSALPPINLMNWMVVIREVHTTYVPEETEEE